MNNLTCSSTASPSLVPLITPQERRHGQAGRREMGTQPVCEGPGVARHDISPHRRLLSKSTPKCTQKPAQNSEEALRKCTVETELCIRRGRNQQDKGHLVGRR